MKFANTWVGNFEAAFRGMRNPLESWDKSDSWFSQHGNMTELGENDLKLAQRLKIAGSEHRKYLRQIFVSVDITGGFHWWKEMDTYKIGTTTDACSTMHKLASKPITIDCFETDDFEDFELEDFNAVVDICERLRQKYLNTKDKKYWKALIRILPESWLQTRTWTANYEVLRNIYRQREGHKLTEWESFRSWVETLPYAKELIC